MLKQKPLDDFQSRGSIVNVTSLCATVAMPGLTAYSASKAGALGLTKVDAFDYGPDQIRVNSVSPGGILTPMLKSTLGAENVKIYSAATPLRRMGKPEDVANAIVWLSSPRAQYITGINLPIDGGLNLATGPP
jgi:NAD(P)-dependent dehydrogenase (short-subunit alcohol dehydrogenase family)